MNLRLSAPVCTMLSLRKKIRHTKRGYNIAHMTEDFFDYDMSYIVVLFTCLLFTTFQPWTYIPTALSAPPPSIPLLKLS